MMTRLKPMQLVSFICISNLVATLTVVVLAAKLWHLPEDQHLPAGMRFFGIAIAFVALAASLAVEWTLQRGIRSNIWLEALLERPRQILSNRPLVVLAATTIVLSFLCFISLPLKHSTTGILLLSISTNWLRLGTILKPKQPALSISPSR
ncbi:MAG: hypothetical protein JST61_10675 [Acidobacteria bacterium]|nr:hypothetical protein [Acidobacteriota bacterium]